MRSKAWKFPSNQRSWCYDQWPVSLRFRNATFETTAIETLPKITSRIMHFFNVQLPPESLEETTPIIPASTDPAAAMRLPEIERSRWQYCAKQRHLREAPKNPRIFLWGEMMVRSREGITKISSIFFFHHIGTGWFFDVWIFQSNFCGINDESRYLLWSCWWIDVALCTLWISGCFLTKIGVHV